MRIKDWYLNIWLKVFIIAVIVIIINVSSLDMDQCLIEVEDQQLFVARFLEFKLYLLFVLKSIIV